MVFQLYWDNSNWYHHYPMSPPSTHIASLWTKEPRGSHGNVSSVLSLDCHWPVCWTRLVSSTPPNADSRCKGSGILKDACWERARTTPAYSPLCVQYLVTAFGGAQSTCIGLSGRVCIEIVVIVLTASIYLLFYSFIHLIFSYEFIGLWILAFWLRDGGFRM